MIKREKEAESETFYFEWSLFNGFNKNDTSHHFTEAVEIPLLFVWKCQWFLCALWMAAIITFSSDCATFPPFVLRMREIMEILTITSFCCCR